MIRRPPRSTQSRSSAASDVYKRQALASVCVLSIVFMIYFFWRMRRQESDYDLLTRGAEGQNFVEIVNKNIVQTLKLRGEVESLSERYAFVLRRMAGAVQHVGVVRYLSLIHISEPTRLGM